MAGKPTHLWATPNGVIGWSLEIFRETKNMQKIAEGKSTHRPIDYRYPPIPEASPLTIRKLSQVSSAQARFAHRSDQCRRNADFENSFGHSQTCSAS